MGKPNKTWNSWQARLEVHAKAKPSMASAKALREYEQKLAAEHAAACAEYALEEPPVPLPGGAAYLSAQELRINLEHTRLLREWQAYSPFAPQWGYSVNKPGNVVLIQGGTSV